MKSVLSRFAGCFLFALLVNANGFVGAQGISGLVRSDTSPAKMECNGLAQTYVFENFFSWKSDPKPIVDTGTDEMSGDFKSFAEIKTVGEAQLKGNYDTFVSDNAGSGVKASTVETHTEIAFDGYAKVTPGTGTASAYRATSTLDNILWGYVDYVVRADDVPAAGMKLECDFLLKFDPEDEGHLSKDTYFARQVGGYRVSANFRTSPDRWVITAGGKHVRTDHGQKLLFRHSHDITVLNHHSVRIYEWCQIKAGVDADEIDVPSDKLKYKNFGRTRVFLRSK